MRIAIIGAGSIGGTLARQLTALGHDVAIANSRGPESLTQLTAGSGATAVALPDVAIAAEVVILALPFGALPTLAGMRLPGVVVDAGNYVPGYRDAAITALGFDGFDAGGLDDSRRQQPGTPVFTADIELGAAREALSQADREQTVNWRRRMAGRA